MKLEITDTERHLLITGIGLVHERQRDPATGLDTDPEQVAELADLERRLQALEEGS